MDTEVHALSEDELAGVAIGGIVSFLLLASCEIGPAAVIGFRALSVVSCDAMRNNSDSDSSKNRNNSRPKQRWQEPKERRVRFAS